VIRRIATRSLAACSILLTASCAPRLVTLPSGPGAPFPNSAAAYSQATEACRGVLWLAAILEISGRAAGSRFPRAKIDAGFEAPGKIVLELPAPGKPIFTFAAEGDTATLVLPREGRALQGASPSETLEVLAGVALGADELRSIVSGCGFGATEPSTGRAFDRGWVAVDAAGVTSYLQQLDGAWRLVAATRGPHEVRYADFASGHPSTIRLRSAGRESAKATDLTIRPSQVDLNQPIDPSAFRPAIPPGTKLLTLDELRKAGPLGR